MDAVSEVRKEFEKIQGVYDVLKEGNIVYDSVENGYYTTDSNLLYRASYLNGVWYAYQQMYKEMKDIKEKLDVYERIDCVLVPKEPTVEMVKAGIIEGGTVWAKDVYKAMINAGEIG